MTSDKVDIDYRLSAVRRQMSEAAAAVNRSSQDIVLLAVSKTKPESAIRDAYASGQRIFGENYVQEGIAKIDQCRDLKDIQWHFIGPIQSNKTKDIASYFDWVHSIDREKIARRLNDQRPEGMPPLQVLIQVNIDDEASKSGVSLAEVCALAEYIQSCPRLQLRGLMAIPKANQSAQEQASSYAALESAFLELKRSDPKLDTLSLGMSDDLAAAIQYGSTMVRIGTAIFGAREGHPQ